MVLAAYIASKTELKSYILEGLGYPVVNIEVTDRQIDNQIDIALEKFIEFGDGGLQKRFTTLKLVLDQREYPMGFETFSISRVYSLGDIKLDAVWPDKLITDFYGQMTRRNDLLTLELSRQYLETLDFMLNVELTFDYNVATRTLYLLEKPSPVTVGILYYERVDYSDETSLIYDHPWIKKYTTALTKKQWGVNLSKYNGSMLPTGVTMDAPAILAEAKEELDKLEQELEEVYRYPTDFFIG